MKLLFIPFLAASFLLAQAQEAPPPPEPAPDTVIATIDGKNLTYGELHSYLSTLSQAQVKAAMGNLELTVRQYALLNKLSSLGEEAKLDQKQPYVEILRAGRMQVMAQAAISEQYGHVEVLPAEQEKYFNEHKAQYSKLKVKAIYIAFGSKTAASDPSKKYRTEEDARKLADQIAGKIHAGGDFAALVQQYSEDEPSKKNAGDWGTVNATDNLPDDFKRAVLALKIGDITEPMRRSGGFYIFKADEHVDRPYAEVKDEIFGVVREMKMRQWMDNLQRSIPVKINAPPAPEKPATPPAGN